MKQATAGMSAADIAGRDAGDPLARMRERFVLPDGVIYLDGNSLGPAPRAALEALRVAAHEEWAQGLIRSWNDAGWWKLPQSIGDKIGRLIGAASGETVACDTTSINIFKVLHAGLALRPDRHVIVAEGDGFPTDLYMAEGVAKTRPGTKIRLGRADGRPIEHLLDSDVAVVLVNEVDYRSGVRRDMAALTALAHDVGAVIAWDLCHSAGAMPVGLNAAKADFAIGCTYKYLNAGPGAPAFVFAAKRHHAALEQPLSGWWGHAKPFAFEPGYEPDASMRRMLCGSQPVLSMRALAAAIDLWDDVDLKLVREKSLGLSQLFIDLVETTCAGHGLTLASPREPEWRGSQVSFAHEHGYPIMQNLVARGVIGDFRAPNLLRFGFAPLYIRFCDVAGAVAILRDILVSGSWRDEKFQHRALVT